MPVLVAVAVLAVVIGLVNLLLTLGVVRRLREHSRMLSESRTLPEITGLLPGEAPGDFAAVSATGRPVSNATGVRVAAFFSTQCSVCTERVEPFISYVSASRINPERVLAVVVGDGTPDGDGLASYVNRLAEVATVCTEQPDGGVATAFKVSGFPAFCLFDDDGRMTAGGYDLDMLPALVG